MRRRAFGVRRVSRFVGLAMILGVTVALATPIGAGPARAAGATRAKAWTAFVVSEFRPNSGTPIGRASAIDTATNTAGRRITVGPDPQNVAITPNGAIVYVADAGNNTVTPIDTATNTAGTPITVGANPEGIAVTPNGATAYVANTGTTTVTPINIATNTPGTPITVGPNPVDIAITPTAPLLT